MDVHTLIAMVSILIPVVSPFLPDKGALPILVMGVLTSFAWLTLEASLQSTIYFWVAVGAFLVNTVLTIGYVFTPLTEERI